ncbi:uncharacterized protein LOC111531162 [Piliocolobus tephrosceles]|uniref:uncharacterized protein LOC111531162 n=1 Tax=Piliocolobus tephrosceles TaxID=591936 RepID=UPI000C2A4DB7|nr:uncharacterized protein LOC111531162 [Piliocolobus tephrosceles]
MEALRCQPRELPTLFPPLDSPPPFYKESPASPQSPLPWKKYGEASCAARLRQIFPDTSLQRPTRPLGGAARDAERGKRGRAGRLSSHAREAAAAEPASAAAAHLGPAAGRLAGGAGGEPVCAVPPEGGRSPRETASDRAEERLTQPILELVLQHLFPKQVLQHSGRAVVAVLLLDKELRPMSNPSLRKMAVQWSQGVSES